MDKRGTKVMQIIDIKKGQLARHVTRAVKAINDGYVIAVPLENAYAYLCDAFNHVAIEAADHSLVEIGRILAAGVVRLNAKKSSNLSVQNGDSFVDFSPRKSGGRRTKRIRIGGTHEASQ